MTRVSAAKFRFPCPPRWFTLWLGLVVLLHPAAAAQLTATLDRTAVRVGESVRLSLNFENCQPSEAPALPNVPNLQFTFGGQSSSYRFVNGQQSAVQTLFYFVSASQPGEYTIPRIVAPVGADRLSTEPLKLRVLKSEEKVPEGEPPGQLAFLKLIVPKTEIYVGEVLPVEVQLYVASGQDLQMQPLTGEGFTFGKAQQLPQRQVQVGGTVYYLVSLKTTAVANKSGRLQLGPAECRLALRIPTNRRRGNDPFDDFFSDPFSPRYELRPVKLASDPLSLQVLPLPTEGQPEGFTGSVGDFTFNVSASPTNVAVGDPIKLRVQVSGKGALEGVNLPPLDSWQEFTTYPPTTQVETTDSLGVEGVKTFQYDVVPQNTSVKQLPGLSFAFFDPVRKAYRTLNHSPTPVIVRPSGSAPPLAQAPAGSATGANPASAQPQDIVHVKQRLGALSQIQPPLLERGWFLGAQLIPVLLLAGAFAWRKRREHLAGNPRVVRRLAVARLVRQGVADLSALRAESDADAFLALVFRLLQEQLGERLDLPAAAITEAVLDEQLGPRGVSPELLGTLHELFRACNQQRYAPGAARQDLAVLLPRVESALRQLQELKL